MKGEVLHFAVESNKGIIRGENGERYSFSSEDWQAEVSAIKIGKIIDFEPGENNRAEHILIISSENGPDFNGIQTQTKSLINDKILSIDEETKAKFLASASHSLVLGILIWGQFLGNYDYYFMGLRLPLLFLLPLILICYLNFNSQNDFIKKHTRKAISNYMKFCIYIVGFMFICLLIPGLSAMDHMGFDLLALGEFTSLFARDEEKKFLTIMLLPFQLILLGAALSSALSLRKSLKMRYPKKKDGMYTAVNS